MGKQNPGCRQILMPHIPLLQSTHSTLARMPPSAMTPTVAASWTATPLPDQTSLCHSVSTSLAGFYRWPQGTMFP